jgi:hypothetical protein
MDVRFSTYAGATILSGNTVVENNSVFGNNV